MTTHLKGSKKLINAWATYDLANSVYNLVITATIFPIYYKAVTTTKDAAGNEVSNLVNFLGFQVKNTTLYDFAIAFAFPATNRQSRNRVPPQLTKTELCYLHLQIQDFLELADTL